jgi:hypothetical protein
MFFVINKRKPPQSLTIGDLNFTLKPNQAIDLEKVFDNYKIGASKDLLTAQKLGWLQIKQNRKPPEPAGTEANVHTLYMGNPDAAIDKMNKEVRGELAGIKEAITGQPQPQLTDSSGVEAELASIRVLLSEQNKQKAEQSPQLDQNQLLEALQKLSDQTQLQGAVERLAEAVKQIQAQQPPTVIHQHGTSKTEEEEIDTLDEVKIAEIHARSVERMTRNITGDVDYKKEKIADSVKTKIDELDNLLG